MTIFRNLRNVKEVLAKPKFPMEITLKRSSYCSDCNCEGKIKAGERVMWAGPNTGQIWHLQCRPCPHIPHCWESEGEMAYLAMEAAYGHKDWWY